MYFTISKNAIELADRLKEILAAKGYTFFLDSPTNQIFVVVPNSKLEVLGQKVRYGFWEKYDGEHTVIRFATGWATTEADLKGLEEIL